MQSTLEGMNDGLRTQMEYILNASRTCQPGFDGRLFSFAELEMGFVLKQIFSGFSKISLESQLVFRRGQTPPVSHTTRKRRFMIIPRDSKFTRFTSDGTTWFTRRLFYNSRTGSAPVYGCAFLRRNTVATVLVFSMMRNHPAVLGPREFLPRGLGSRSFGAV